MTCFRAFILFIFAVLLVIIPVHGGEQGRCRFEGSFCSCKLGQENRGLCWDRVSGTPSNGICESRYCRAGWVCSCPGRTHLCELKDRPVNVIDSRLSTNTSVVSRRLSTDTAECHEESVLKPVAPFQELGLTLGTFEPSFSRKGLLANACRQIAWWYNGILMGAYGKEPEITGANIDAQMERRTNHTLLEFKPGDLLAFRFKNASYHCYNHLSILSVNGTATSTADPGIESLFSRGHTDKWFTPSFSPVVKSDESSADTTDFIPLRSAMLSGDPDVPGVDNWKEPDGSEDHKVSNFYFRITIL